MSTQKHNDGLANVVSGLGTSRSKRYHNTFLPAVLGDFQHLEAAYSSDWLAAKIVNIRAEDECCEWRRIKCAQAEEIEQAEQSFGVASMVQEARTWARLYGGAGVVMITDQALDKPLNLNAVRRGSLKQLLVFDRIDLVPNTINTWDVLSPNYLQPEYYILRGGAQLIHWSHVARFQGELLPKRLRAQTQGWGDSSLRRAIEPIADLVSSINGIAELMQEANVDVIKREGLTEELSTDQDDAIIQRYQLFSQAKSIVNLALLDGEESYDRKTLSLSGVAPIIEQFITFVSGVADTPVTRLFGTSAKGMNATGEGDESNYFKSIRASQRKHIDPGLRTIDEVLVRSTLGEWPDDFDYVWNPLKQLDDLQVAQAEKYRADKHRIYLEDGVVVVGQVQRELQSSEEYQFDDGQIEQNEDYEFIDSYMQLSAAGVDHDSIMRKLNP